MATIRLRRSVLFMPGSNARALEKARALDCDVVALDLEDAVAPEAKAVARDRVCAAVRDRRFGHREVVVRINALSSPWGSDDLNAVLAAKPDAVILPKVAGADDLKIATGGIPCWAMIETCRAILNLAEIAAGGAAVLMLGTNDLLKDMHALALPARENLGPALSQAVIAARAHGIGVIDGTFNALDDATGFAAVCEQGKAFGFDGKTLIHPSQIEACNRIFAPSVTAIAQAKQILAAFAEPQNSDKGVIQVDGRMIERLHADSAARLVAEAELIAARHK